MRSFRLLTSSIRVILSLLIAWRVEIQNWNEKEENVNPFSVPSLICAVLFLFLGIAVVSYNPKAKLNLILGVLSFNWILFAVSLFMLHLSENAIQASFWNKWPYRNSNWTYNRMGYWEHFEVSLERRILGTDLYCLWNIYWFVVMVIIYIKLL